jgi:hypothetical protein
MLALPQQSGTDPQFFSLTQASHLVNKTSRFPLRGVPRGVFSQLKPLRRCRRTCENEVWEKKRGEKKIGTLLVISLSISFSFPSDLPFHFIFLSFHSRPPQRTS